jgi:CRP-like cAMP-binding protein
MRKVLYLMGTLTDGDAEWLAAHGDIRFVPAKVEIIRQGQPIEALFILLEGKLSVRRSDLHDRDVARLYPGELLGEISFVDGRPPSASVVSTEESHLLVVRRDVLSKKLVSDDGFAARFYRGLAIFLADRLRTTTANLGYGKGSETRDQESEALDEGSFDEISLAARRFDHLLRRLRLAHGTAW